jgi:membrane protease YdiL (CAAX protease family)
MPPSDAPVRLSPARRESPWVLCVGIVLFLCVLSLVWYRGNERSTGAPTMSAYVARLNTYIVESLAYWEAQGTVPVMPFTVHSQARQTAALWEKLSVAYPDAPERALTQVNAAALYGVAGSAVDARRALARAEALHPTQGPAIRALLPLYSTPAKPITLSPDTESVLNRLSTGPLIRARAREVAGDHAGALRALAPGAKSGRRVMAFASSTFFLAFTVFLFAIITFAVKYAAIRAALHAAAQPAAVHLPWGIGTALIVISLHHLCSFSIGGILYSLAGSSARSMETALLFGVAGTILSAILVLGVFLLFLGYRPWDWWVLGWQRTTRGMGYGLLTLLLILPLFWLVSLLSGSLFDTERGTNPVIQTLLSTRSVWMQVYLALAAMVMAPLVEETFYRGLLFRALGERVPFWGAALLSGLLFALAHGQLMAILPITVLGTAFAFLTRHTGSLLASATAHGVYNGLVTIALLVLLWTLRGPGG